MKYLFAVLILFIFDSSIFPQESTANILVPDSLTSLSLDSLSIKDSTSQNKSDVDTVIYASASDSLIFFVQDKKMNIYGDGSLKYKTTDLKSADIAVDFKTNNVDAKGVPSDSVPDKFVNTPVLTDKGETYQGLRMKYNFKTLRGDITSAGTESEGAYYTGEKIKKVDKETYYIKDGIYTTCKQDTPHYYFYSPEMMVINKQELVAKWIWLYFGGVPFPIPLPFAVFPIQSGRRSGIIMPAFGNDGTYGFYFSRFGYFWAINDYMDINLTADYFTRGSYTLNSRFRYAKRYNYSGNFQASYLKYVTQLKNDPDRTEKIDWRLNWTHNQNITPSLKFDANLQFESGINSRRNLSDINEQLNKQIVSNATFYKTWDESGNSLSLSYQRNQDLQTGNISEVLPSMTFSMSQKYPFKRKNSIGSQKWYELIGFNYNSKFQNDRNKTNGNLQIRGGIQHNFSTSASPKIGYVSITPNFNYTERWYNKRIEMHSDGKDSAGNEIIETNDVKEINFVRTFNTGVSASTKFYGIFQPNILGISAIRHTVQPSISYTYTPDFSKPGWGYYGTYVNSNGQTVKYSKFQKEIFGGASSGESQAINFSLSNIFEMKTQVDPTDTTEKEKKIQLLNLNAGIGYNFAADSVKFSDLSLSYRTQVGDWFSFNGGSRFTLYDVNSNGGRINKFLVNEGKGLVRMTNFNFSVSTSLSGEKLKSKDSDKEKQENEDEDQFVLNQDQNNVYQGIYSDKEADFSIPWDVSLSYNYTRNSPTPLSITSFSNLNASLNFNLTPQWKLSFTGSYDFDRKEFAAPQIKISRDLDCWLMNFTWNPIGTYRGFRFEIRVKASQLQDLKITKQSDFYSGK